ncbi:anti-sigma-factor antagonist [Planococcus antarcticus DSM 14505]|uniref:Anti-anti-sigma factor n=1 Tax=Planococcus antarcticus DSM 14505 TaxID=1185653 RepID=A0A1C7DJ32_9BACL|nr:STAS domain-containing protein [Planococcus antarcticus]ANU11427.1 anti-anti-sigma factor [Planococcus antarcticus DSM 14505]EIM06623.1 anti-sigma-factor antagonist [Planococcus antarcticus DSM 14505]
MLKDQDLFEHLSAQTWKMTEDWYRSLDKSKAGVYGSTDPDKVALLKKQTHEFHLRFCVMFQKDNNEFVDGFQDWIETIAKDEAHLDTPIVEVIDEFFRAQQQYLDEIGAYVLSNKEQISHEKLMEWTKVVVLTFSKVIVEFTDKNSKAAEKRMNSQQQMIVEMSAPIILLAEKMGMLPLIGEITPYRAEIMFEKALAQSSKNNLEKLFIDLSGVPLIDTMVAQQVFQLIKGLEIIGVRVALSGISPVIAQTAVQLGIKFIDIEVYNTIAQALKQNRIHLV